VGVSVSESVSVRARCGLQVCLVYYLDWVELGWGGCCQVGGERRRAKQLHFLSFTHSINGLSRNPFASAEPGLGRKGEARQRKARGVSIKSERLPIRQPPSRRHQPAFRSSPLHCNTGYTAVDQATKLPKTGRIRIFRCPPR
jgi:hypothetical protein